MEQKGFDGEFYKFRGAIKALERRLVSVLSQGFEDCSTIFDAFKLIESFEGLLEREFIQVRGLRAQPSGRGAGRVRVSPQARRGSAPPAPGGCALSPAGVLTRPTATAAPPRRRPTSSASTWS